MLTNGAAYMFTRPLFNVRFIVVVRRIMILNQILDRKKAELKIAVGHNVGHNVPADRVKVLLTMLRHNHRLWKSVRMEASYAIKVVATNSLYETQVTGGAGDTNAREQGIWLQNVESVMSKKITSPEASELKVGQEEEHKQFFSDLMKNCGSPIGQRNTFLNPGAQDLIAEDNIASLERLVKTLDRWTFDVFKLDALTSGNALFFVWNKANELLDVSQYVIAALDTWEAFCTKIQSSYSPQNPYHSEIHAADVTHSALWFLTTGHVRQMCKLSATDAFAVIMAAAIHDVDHPALNNKFHSMTNDELALLYNDKAVLENHHLAFAYTLLQDPKYDFLHGLSKSRCAEMRECIIHAVLGTDMAMHFEELGSFRTRIANEDRPFPDPGDRMDKLAIMRVVLHSSDISNPTKALKCYNIWIERVLTEYFEQGDRERKLGMPISMFMDRFTTNIAKNQLGFIDFVVTPLYEAVALAIPQVQQTQLENLASNRRYWEERVDLMQESLERGDSVAGVWIPSVEDEDHIPG
jgi:hypothetical protein